MRLINCNEVDMHRRQEFKKGPCFQTFGRNIQEFIIAVRGVLQGLPDLQETHTRVNGKCWYSFLFQVLYLVAH
jgi:hypothetical protein